MIRVLQLMALIAALALPALCQNGRLSPDDQREFDKAYGKWVNDSRKNDRDDIQRDERRMQDIMQRNNIPPDVPYDRIASSGSNGYYGDRDNDRYRDNDHYRDNDRYRGGNSAYGQTRLSPDDQREFDKAYDKWAKDSRKNDHDDIRKDERRMQDIMARYNIPRDVPYDQIATPNSEYRH
jgi:hypothetical protein